MMFSAKIGDFGTGALAVCNGAPDNGSLDTDTDNAKTWTGRVFFTPFAKTGSFFEGFGVGTAGDYGIENGSAPSYLTSGQVTFFSYKKGVATQSDSFRLCPQASFYWGPIGLEGEWVQSAYGLVNGASMATVFHEAWQTTASFVFGGKASYTGALPDKSFDLSKGQLGALELGLRASQLDLDPNVFSGGFADPKASAQRAFSMGVGCNWAPEPRFKLSLDWEWTEFKGGAAAGGDRLPEEVFLTRLQSFF
jgi:phosphate-selective porin OprO/OprP